MRADSDHHPIAARVVQLLRVTGRQMRKRRGLESTFYSACTDLTLDAWDPARFPGVAYGHSASDLIYDEMAAAKPSMICRIGAVELYCMAATSTELTWGNAFKLAAGDDLVRDIGMRQGLLRSLCTNAGFFPASVPLGRRFVELMCEDLKEVDVLGTWCKQEAVFSDQLAQARKVRFRDLEPYMHDKPWSRVLAGKRVLVVHPFAETIASQYRRRAKLFSNPDVLPEFELQTIKAVQSIANTKTQFETWFDALDHMKAQMTAADFDVAIIGCGAYGLPLAAHAKRLGKKGVHLGGQTQLLFGIKGKRWETDHEEIARHFNEHWVYPAEEDRPKDFRVVEGGAYW